MRRTHVVALLLALLLLPAPGRGDDDPETAEDGDAGPGGGAAAESDPGKAPPGAAGQAWLGARVDAAWARRPVLAKARFGLVVATLDGEELVVRRGDDGFNVASSAKLLTAGAALATLGPGYRFSTSIVAEPRRGARPAARGDRFPGDLVLVGGADPTLDARGLGALADAVARRGWRTFEGSLVVDTGFFDEDDLPPVFAQKTEDAAFRAPVSAASLAGNAVTVRVLPAATAGAPARLFVEPASAHVVVKNETTTVARGRTVVRAASIAGAPGPRGAARTELTVRGTVRLDAAEVIVRKRIEHPAQFTGEALRALLAARGVVVARGELIVRTRRAPPAADAVLLATHDSPALAEIIRHLGKRSDNFTAEVLLKTLGAERGGVPGTWAAGLGVVRAWLGAIGVTGELRYENGSGLYDATRLTPRQMITVLRVAWNDFRLGPDFVAALAIAGVDGTLAKRLAGPRTAGWIRAKTGTLEGVVSLCGYAGAPGKPPLVFAVMVNDLGPGEARHARAFVDAVAAAIVALHAQEPR